MLRPAPGSVLKGPCVAKVRIEAFRPLGLNCINFPQPPMPLHWPGESQILLELMGVPGAWSLARRQEVSQGLDHNNYDGNKSSSVGTNHHPNLDPLPLLGLRAGCLEFPEYDPVFFFFFSLFFLM